MKPISNEIRKQIIDAKLRKEEIGNIAKWFNTSQSSVVKIWRRYRETGSYKPIPYLGKKSRISAEKKEEIINFVNKNPDKTLNEIIDELNLPIKNGQLSKILIAANFSFKKKLHIQQHKTVKRCKKKENYSSKPSQKLILNK